MDRIPDIDESRVDYWRQYHVQDANNGGDDDLAPEERRNRADVITGTHLKRGDDITLVEAIPLRVIGPGRGWNVILAYYPAWFGDQVQQFEIAPGDLTDRAPLDPNETPMPVFPGVVDDPHP